MCTVSTAAATPAIAGEVPPAVWNLTALYPDDAAWDQSIETFRAGIAAMAEMVSDPTSDVLAPLPHAKGTSIMGQVLLAADHNAYHVGQLVIVRRLLGAWTG